LELYTHGTNNFHGDAAEYSPTALEARNFFGYGDPYLSSQHLRIGGEALFEGPYLYLR